MVAWVISQAALPGEVTLVDEDAHQLRHRERGMGVVQLDGDLVREGVEAPVIALVASHDVPQRAGDQEVLLDETELVTGRYGVGGIEHLGDGFRRDLLFHGFHVVAGVEDPHVEVVRRPRGEEAEEVHRPAAVADDGVVVGYADAGTASPATSDCTGPGDRPRARCGHRRGPGTLPRAARSPRGSGTQASCRASPSARRAGSPGGRGRTRSGSRSRSRACRGWRANRGSRPRAGPARRFRARRRARSLPPRRGRPRGPAGCPGTDRRCPGCSGCWRGSARAGTRWRGSTRAWRPPAAGAAGSRGAHRSSRPARRARRIGTAGGTTARPTAGRRSSARGA